MFTLKVDITRHIKSIKIILIVFMKIAINTVFSRPLFTYSLEFNEYLYMYCKYHTHIQLTGGGGAVAEVKGYTAVCYFIKAVRPNTHTKSRDLYSMVFTPANLLGSIFLHFK